jgi:hypothetical protein
MPVNHSSWDDFVVFENKQEEYCKNHIKGGYGFPEWLEPILDELCKVP